MESQCKICSNPYDLNKYIPMILCKDLHYCCAPCAQEILSSDSVRKKCPQCRVAISKTSVVKFRHYTNLLEQTKAHQKRIEILESSANLLPQYRETIQYISSYDGKENPQYYAFLRNTAENMIQQKKYSAAKTILKGMIENQPTCALYHFFGIGSTQEERGFSEQCNINWHKKKAKQRYISAEDLLNYLFLQNFNYFQQKQWYEKLLSSHPQNIRLLYGLALTQHNSENFSKALELYHSLVKLYPSFSKPFQMIAFIKRKLRQQSQAVKFAKLCLQRQENNIFALFVIASIDDTGQLDKIMKIQPKYVRAVNLMGINQMKCNKYTSAKQIFQMCIKENPYYIKSYINLAHTQLQLQNYKAVILLVTPVLTQKLTSWERSMFYYFLGTSQRKLDNLKASVESLKRSIKENSKNKESMLTLAQIYVEKAENNQAISVYQSYLVQYPSDPYVFQQIISCYQKIGNSEMALHYVDQWLKIQPQNVVIKSVIADIHFRDENWTDSLEYYLKCFKIGFKKNIFYMKVMHCLFKLKQYQEALKYVGQLLIQQNMTSDQYDLIIQKANQINQARKKK